MDNTSKEGLRQRLEQIVGNPEVFAVYLVRAMRNKVDWLGEIDRAGVTLTKEQGRFALEIINAYMGAD